MEACKLHGLETVTNLIRAGASVNHACKQGLTALIESAFNERAEITAFLIESGADVKLKSKQGLTPLMAAITGPCHTDASREFRQGLRSGEIAELLIRAGASTDCVDDEEQSALMLAEANHHIGWQRILRLFGAPGVVVSEADNTCYQKCSPSISSTTKDF